MKKFFKRKFLSPILFGLLVVLNRKLGLGLSETELGYIAAPVTAFIIGESAVDFKAVKK